MEYPWYEMDRNKVEIIVHKYINQNVTDLVLFSARVMLIIIRSKPININIIQVYSSLEIEIM